MQFLMWNVKNKVLIYLFPLCIIFLLFRNLEEYVLGTNLNQIMSQPGNVVKQDPLALITKELFATVDTAGSLKWQICAGKKQLIYQLKKFFQIHSQKLSIKSNKHETQQLCSVNRPNALNMRFNERVWVDIIQGVLINMEIEIQLESRL